MGPVRQAKQVRRREEVVNPLSRNVAEHADPAGAGGRQAPMQLAPEPLVGGLALQAHRFATTHDQHRVVRALRMSRKTVEEEIDPLVPGQVPEEEE